MSDNAKVIAECLEDIANNVEGFKTYLVGRGTQASLDDRLLTALAFQQVKFAEAFQLLAKPGYYEASATITRAMYETYLWARWILLDPAANGMKYFKTGQRKAHEKAKKLNKHDALAKSEKAQEVLNAELPPVPTVSALVQALAKQDPRMERYHDLIYGTLCDFSHVNAAGSIDARNNLVSLAPQPDHEQTMMISMLTRQLVAHFWQMLEVWWTEHRISEPPT